MEEKSQKYGYYSTQAEKEYGHAIWKHANGTEVMVTSIGSEEDPKKGGYMWPDAVTVGPVTCCVKANQRAIGRLRFGGR